MSVCSPRLSCPPRYSLSVVFVRHSLPAVHARYSLPDLCIHVLQPG